MAQYITEPILVNAIQYNGHNTDQIFNEINGVGFYYKGVYKVRTHRGEVTPKVGDWVVSLASNTIEVLSNCVFKIVRDAQVVAEKQTATKKYIAWFESERAAGLITSGKPYIDHNSVEVFIHNNSQIGAIVGDEHTPTPEYF